MSSEMNDLRQVNLAARKFTGLVLNGCVCSLAIP